MKKKSLSLLALLLIVAIATVACAQPADTQEPAAAEPAATQEPAATEKPSAAVPDYNWDTSWPATQKYVRIVSGGVGGSWYPLGARLAYHLGSEFPKVAFSGLAGTSTGNVQSIHNGEAELSINDLLPTIQGFKGEKPYEEEMPELRLVGNFQMTNFGAFVRADSDINTFEDMVDKDITTTRTASDFITIAMSLLGISEDSVKAAGGTISYSTNADCVQMIQDKQADVFFCQGFVGKPDVMSLDETVGIRWVGMSEEQADMLLQNELIGQLGAKVKIPAGSLKGQTEEALTIGMPQVIITSEKMPEQLIYWVTKTLIEQSEDLGSVSGHYPTPETVLNGYQEGVTPPFHEGAIKYYKEIGIMK
jgi:TRAP transporter TAXI family solute receptor